MQPVACVADGCPSIDATVRSGSDARMKLQKSLAIELPQDGFRETRP